MFYIFGECISMAVYVCGVSGDS